MSEEKGMLSEWNKRYAIEYLVALGLSIAAAAFCIPAARTARSELVRIGVMALIVAAILVMSFAVYRHFRRVDEFIRHLMVECFAVAGAFAMAAALAYALLEMAGLPEISMWWIFGGTALVWNLWMLRAVRR